MDDVAAERLRDTAHGKRAAEYMYLPWKPRWQHASTHGHRRLLVVVFRAAHGAWWRLPCALPVPCTKYNGCRVPPAVARGQRLTKMAITHAPPLLSCKRLLDVTLGSLVGSRVNAHHVPVSATATLAGPPAARLECVWIVQVSRHNVVVSRLRPGTETGLPPRRAAAGGC